MPVPPAPLLEKPKDFKYLELPVTSEQLDQVMLENYAVAEINRVHLEKLQSWLFDQMKIYPAK